jgi:anti-sigma B factor antagonist
MNDDLQHPGSRDITVVELHGEFDLGTAESVSAELGDVDPESGILVDLGQVTFVDSTTLSCFISASRRHQRHGSRFVLANAQGAVRRVLAITGLDEALDYRDTVPEAQLLLSLPRPTDPEDAR